MIVYVYFTDKSYKKQMTVAYTNGQQPTIPRIGEQVTLHNCERPLMLKVTRVLHEYRFHEDKDHVHEVYVELR